MNIAYLVNRYPTVSHTFVRREIAGIEAEGHQVTRFSIRAGPDDLPDPADRAERDRTIVVLQRPLSLLLGIGRHLLSRPDRVLAAWRASGTMVPRSIKGIVTRTAYLAEACRIADAMAAAGVRHLHAHFGTNPAAVARMTHLLSGVPYSFTVHGPDEFDEPRQLDLAGKIADAKFVVAISDYGRSQLCRWVEVDRWPRIVVVRCGVDLSAIDRADGQATPGHDFCAVARLAPQKGLPILIEALGILRRSGLSPRVAIVGDGPLRTTLEREAARIGVGDQLTLLGSRGGADVAAQLRAAKAMVLPSFAEGLPVVLMESLAVGTPVVTTAVAGIPELVDAGCGWVVPAGSAQALADAMAAALATAPERLADMGAEGRRRVERAHDARENARALLAHMVAA
ncbi:glycosyltransferase family 4 protein [Sphingomonas sp. KR1UV-12]|uniref:Glycosyltransferase family 4 protein n=1 Tax=Sphingomonas aurea TaxID=3063994 RepID=A0ABT9EFM5_9SPHN|nr:glycosyltransferase family 4 protein [Sphingomonas sp. KR1UV-12]MDP1025588.1 glycosyltransferase family 4 protein [Sphingomonas sp. KR1UV-12]